MVKDVMNFITQSDPEVGKAIEAEYARQKRNIELIASENIVSEAVMMAMGTVLTNKVCQKVSRPSATTDGCECVDVVENIAIERAKKLFGADHACVQPHSGASANLAVYFAPADQTGRHRSGTQPGSRRSPDPRQPGQPVPGSTTTTLSHTAWTTASASTMIRFASWLLSTNQS